MSKKYYFLNIPQGIFSCPEDIKGSSQEEDINVFDSDCDIIYDIYDDLAIRFPQYVTKVKMGEVEGYDFNRYRFSYYEMENTSGIEQKRLKILISTALHGYEPGSAWVAAQFFRLLCERADDEILGFLLRYVVFEVVPVANPYGFSKNIRTNENGVDINRNFPVLWESRWPKESTCYAGEAPASEASTKFLMQFIEENLDADYLIDYHNRSRPLPSIYVRNEEDVQIAYSTFATLTAKWQKQYKEIDQDRILGYVAKSGAVGVFVDYATEKGLCAFTLETPEQMGEISRFMNDKNTVHTAMDVLVNMILALVTSYR